MTSGGNNVNYFPENLLADTNKPVWNLSASTC